MWRMCIRAGDPLFNSQMPYFSSNFGFFFPRISFFFQICITVSEELSVRKCSYVSAFTAQEEIFWELHWCSGLSWIAVLSGVFHNGTWAVSAWYIAPRGESALCTNLSVPSQRKAEWHAQASANMAPHHIQNLLYIDGMAPPLTLHRGNVLSDHTQATVVLQMLFLLWLLEEMFC